MNCKFVSRCRDSLILAALLVCEAVGAQLPSAPVDMYRVQFLTNDEVSVSAQLLVRTGLLVMDGGSKPDARSANVADLQVTAADGKPINANYDPQQGNWTLAVSRTQRINLSYAVHLNSLRALPAWAHLQYGFFDGDAVYLVMRGLIVAPDSTASTDAATVSFSLPQGAKVAAPWRYDEGKQSYTSTIAALVNNSIVVGKFSQVSYREGNFSIAAVLLGEWPSHQPAVERVIRASVAHDLQLFSGTPEDQYLVTLASGDEDGQSFTTSNSISTRLGIVPDDTEIWANTIAHELFHHWNARLIHTNDKRAAFFVEGFTEYYANRQVLAESLIDQPRFWNMVAFHLGAYSYFNYSPNYGVSIADAGTNKSKNRFGVYDGGWTVALCLDLALRANHQSLDDLMKLMWQRFGQAGQAYNYEDLVKAVSDVAGRDMTPFFDKYVAGTDELPFRNDLARIGVAAYDQPFGGEAYVKVNPRNAAERLAYDAFFRPRALY
jgi:predicted metalloprotease with PDZ domain